MNEKAKQTTFALKLSITVAAFLAVMKILTGLITHSMAVIASALDSIMDVSVSTVNLIAAKEASKPPDEDHAYGHGKIESLAGLFQSTFIGLSGLFLIFESVRRLIRGTSIESISQGIVTMFLSMVITFFLVWRLTEISRQNRSTILATEKLHFSTDIMTNASALAALVLVRYTGNNIWDLIVSIATSVYIFRASYKILRNSIDELLDRSLPPVSKEEIEKLILEHHPAIVGLHNFRSRRVGDQIFLDFHIEIRGEDDFKKAHLLTEALITEIQGRYEGADITVHYDPEGED